LTQDADHYIDLLVSGRLAVNGINDELKMRMAPVLHHCGQWWQWRHCGNDPGARVTSTLDIVANS